jgi:hypothetical protein
MRLDLEGGDDDGKEEDKEQVEMALIATEESKRESEDMPNLGIQRESEKQNADLAGEHVDGDMKIMNLRRKSARMSLSMRDGSPPDLHKLENHLNKYFPRVRNGNDKVREFGVFDHLGALHIVNCCCFRKRDPEGFVFGFKT